MRSQRDTAPLRGGPNASAPREDGAGCGIVVDRDLERAEMALGGADRALHHRKFGDARRRHAGRRRDQHGHVEMILEQLAGLDRALVAAIDQDHALARQADERNLGQRLGGGREQRRHLRPGLGGVGRPAGGLADVGEGDRRRRFLRDLGEQRRLLRAGDGERRAACGGGAEALELGAAELARGRDLRAAAAALDRARRRAASCLRRSRSGWCAFRPFRLRL